MICFLKEDILGPIQQIGSNILNIIKEVLERNSPVNQCIGKTLLSK